MTDWIKHDGGPQPVADDVWIECAPFTGGQAEVLRAGVDPSLWNFKLFYRVLNQHLIDAARLDGIRLGLEAAAKEVAEKVEERIGVPCPDGIKGCAVFHFRRTERDRSVFEIKQHLKTLDPETIAKEASREP